MALQLLTLQERPKANTRELMQLSWPAFMTPDAETMKYWRKLRTTYPEFQFLLMDGDTVAGMGNTVPIAWSGDSGDLPSRWADTFIPAVEQPSPKTASALAAVNIAIHPDYRNSGCSRMLLEAIRTRARQLGLQQIVVPVRPSFKSSEPESPFEEYIHRVREDGAPADPWIRTHWRLGARIVKPIPEAYTIQGTIAEWAAWTGQAFPVSGEYLIDGALMPVRIDLDRDEGIYHDPNVWMEYRVPAAAAR